MDEQTKPTDHDKRMRVASRYARWYLGSPSWARNILDAYWEPERVSKHLDEEEKQDV